MNLLPCIAEKFNDFFVHVGPNLAKSFTDTNDFETYLKGEYRNSMFIYETTCDKILKIINKFKSKNSCGIDRIIIKVIKYVNSNYAFISYF